MSQTQHPLTTANFAIISARFDAKAGKALQTLRQTCQAELRVQKVKFTEFRVPGAFEIPTLAQKILNTRPDFDGIIALGVIVRGETLHFELVAENCARRLADLGVAFAKPVIFGVLTVNSREQAEARAERGTEFALAAIQLAQTLQEVERG